MVRPFYIIGHNPNDAGLARAFIEGGANAIEPDVNVYADGTGRLCISHDEGSPGASSVDAFFQALNQLASEQPHFCLVYLDCKTQVATPEHATALLASVRQYLTVGDGDDLKVVISVPSLHEANVMFPAIAAGLRANEALMIDEENDPAAVARFFRRLGVTQQCYGNGDSVPLLPTEPLFPHVMSSVQSACQLRDAGYGPRWVVGWTFNTQVNQRTLVGYGADGIIVDRGDAIRPNGLENLKQVLAGSAQLRLAIRDDRAF
jgi:glycerophosphoryl diester phosphodiesterase